MIWMRAHKDAFVTHKLKNETVLQLFQETVRNCNYEHQPCYQRFLDLVTHAADDTGMTERQMTCRMQLGLPMAPWYDAISKDKFFYLCLFHLEETTQPIC